MEHKPPKDLPQSFDDHDNGKLGIFRLEAGKAKSSRLSRRDFLNIAGIIASGALLEACGLSSPEPTSTPTVTETPQPTATPTLAPTPIVENIVTGCEKDYTTVMAHATTIYRMEFSLSGKYLGTASADQTFKIWDASTYELMKTVQLPANAYQDVSFFNSDTTLVYSGGAGELDLWDITNGKLLVTIATQTDSVGEISVSSPLGKLVFAASEGKLGVMDIASRTVDKFLPTENVYIRGIDISPDGKLLVVGGETRLELWDIASGELMTSKNTVEENALNRDTTYCFSPDGTLILAGSSLLQTSTLTELRHLTHGEESIYPTGKGIFSPDGRFIALPCADFCVRIWDSAAGNLLKSINIGDQPRSVAFSADGKSLAVGANGELLILDAAQFDPAQTVCLFDQKATSQGNNIVVYQKTDAFGVLRTYAVPGEYGENEIPAGTTCLCNSVQGEYDPTQGGGGSSGGSGTYCTCNSVCICMAV